MTAAPPPDRLTAFSHGAGCGCKIGPEQLADVLGRLAPPRHPDLLVGTDHGDDAAVWRLDDERALVATTDFFTPIVDDARTWGRIAATNAASDVYAMGGRPLFALNLVAWPTDVLGNDVLAEVLAGGADAAAEGGWVAVGGHSIDDAEPKYGQAVVGEVHPDRVLTNAGMRAGDHLVLTKALGTGAITTAVKHGKDVAGALDAAVASMVTLNAAAAQAATGADASACTDVTGFGLLGHLRKMVTASGVGATIWAAEAPALHGAREALADGMVSGGTRRNREWVDAVTDADGVEEADLLLLADAQTSGGLLFAAAPEAARAAVDRLQAAGLPAAVIGQAGGTPGRITVRPGR